MDILLYALHVMVCIVLIVVVLLQHGKGADMGAMLGGGASNTVFGARGAGNFLTKMTTACAVIFMFTSLSLAYLGNLGTGDAIFDSDFDAETSAPAADALAEGLEEEASASALEEIPLPANEPEAIPATEATTESVPEAAADPEAGGDRQ